MLINITTDPPSRLVTLGTEIEFGVLGPQVVVGKTISTTDHDYCYMYV
jgi:hypothetical protein